MCVHHYGNVTVQRSCHGKTDRCAKGFLFLIPGGSQWGGGLWAQQLWVCRDLVGLWERSWQPVRLAGEDRARLLQPLGKHRGGLPDPGCVARLKLYLSTLFMSVRLIWCCRGGGRGGGLLLDSEDRLSSPKWRCEAGPKTVW